MHVASIQNVIAFLPYAYRSRRLRYSGRERTIAPWWRYSCRCRRDVTCVEPTDSVVTVHWRHGGAEEQATSDARLRQRWQRACLRRQSPHESHHASQPSRKDRRHYQVTTLIEQL